MKIFVILNLLLITYFSVEVLSCSKIDRDSLLSFFEHVSSSPPTNPPDCCKWEGITCNEEFQVTHLSLPGKNFHGIITPFLGNLSFLTHLNLSRNRFSGSLPVQFFHRLSHLESLDLSFNLLSGWSPNYSLPMAIQTVDLSSNQFNGSIDSSLLFHHSSSLISFNISNNSFTGQLPLSMCMTSSQVKMLDFSMNKFNSNISHGNIGKCSKLEVFRAGFNSLSGGLPSDLFSVKPLRELSLPQNQFSGPINNIVLLSNISIIDFSENEFTGEIPADIGLLSNLKQLKIHSNRFNRSLPPSLINCTNLEILVLRNNHLDGEISSLDFSKLKKLQVIDIGNNSFVGDLPASLCACNSLTAIRLAFNQMEGEIPACMSALKSLSFLSLSNNKLFNAERGLRILMKCHNLTVLLLARCFHDEPMPNHYSLLQSNGFQNLEIISLAGGQFKGEFPSWIQKLKKIKLLNLSYNHITGEIPRWLGSMPNLFHLNLTHDHLSGELPKEFGRLKALISDNTEDIDLSYFALPFIGQGLEFHRLFNLGPAIKFGNNNLSGNIPAELGQLKRLRQLDLGHNNFNGSIPFEMSNLVNLEKLDMSNNNLSGEIPQSLTKLYFLSSFKVENNDLRGEIPKGGQFDIFPATSFLGNPKLCGYLLGRSCRAGGAGGHVHELPSMEESVTPWYTVPFGLGYLVGFLVVIISLLFTSSCNVFN